MFGKTKDSAAPSERRADIAIDDFFGDEAAVAEAERIDKLHQRMTGVEQQLNSQFTSMAAYAQIAQEQIELVRAENQNANERTEQRVISLVERERNDRLNGEGLPSGEVTARLDALEGRTDGEIRIFLGKVKGQLCLRVHDNGPGAESSTLERAGDLFFTTKDQGRGTGLGLAHVHSVVHGHGGAVHLSSDLGRFFQVEILLPILARDEA